MARHLASKHGDELRWMQRPRARARESALLARKPRTLWSDTFHQFRRHRLAMLGLTVLVLLVVAVLIGPAIWHKPINDINFLHKYEGPSVSHPSGRMGWARICWPACSTAAGSRCQSASSRC